MVIQLEICAQPVHVMYHNHKPGDSWETFYLTEIYYSEPFQSHTIWTFPLKGAIL
jgi:hypothetical protein